MLDQYEKTDKGPVPGGKADNLLIVSVLIVEDDPADCLLLEEALFDAQTSSLLQTRYEVTRAGNLAAAEERLAQTVYDIVVSDLQLPDSPACQTIERLVRAADRSAIVLMSGMNDEKLALQAIQMGVQDYLLKGQYDAALLGRTLRYALERKQMQRRQAALAQVELTLSSPEELYEMLTRVCELTETLLPASGGASIVLWDYETQSFYQGASTVPETRNRNPAEGVRQSNGATRWIIDQCEPLVVPNVADGPFGTNQLIEEAGIQSYLGVPLISDNKAIGVLYALEKHPRAFTGGDVDFQTSLAHRAAAAIAKVRQFEQEKEERRLAQRLWERDRILFQVTQALIHSTRSEEVIQAVMEGIVKAIGCHWVTFISLDHANRAVSAIYRDGPGTSLETNISFDELEEGLTGWVLRHRQTAVSPKSEEDKRESITVRRRRLSQNIGGIVVVPVVFQSEMLGTITALNRLDQPDFDEDDVRLLNTLATQAAVAMGNAKLFEQTQRLANIDTLTEIYNRRRFFELAEREVEPLLSNRPLLPCSAIMFDIDHFKQVNDLYGHDCGDQVLRLVANRARGAIRSTDIFGRYGGEEFSILLPNTDLEHANHVAERLCNTIAATPISVSRGELYVTVSVGVAQLHPSMRDLSDLLIAADKALYAAKTNGRNQVITHRMSEVVADYAEVIDSALV